MNQNQHPLLEIRDLRTSFLTDMGLVRAVDGVSLSIPRGKTVAVVGESGCGKSTIALSILRLIPQQPGNIDRGKILLYEDPSPTVCENEFSKPIGAGCHAQADRRGHERSISKHGRASPGQGTREEKPFDTGKPIDLLQLDERDMRHVRGGRIAMIFQEPLTSLNPVYTVGDQIVEAIELHQPLRGKKAWNKAVEMLDRVGIIDPQTRAYDYPHQLSGGMRQRVMIAMALSCEPSLLIADEPTTALDVTIQAQILDLLRSLQQEHRMSMLIITHDLGVVAQMADEVYVMYAGRIIEHARTAALFDHPLHPYTRGLLRCTPQLGRDREKNRLDVIPGKVPDLSSLPSGCRFHPRCDLTARRAQEESRITILIDREHAESPISPPSVAEQTPRHTQDLILKRCVEGYDEEPSGSPPLREARPGHFVACWEI